jgi:hypothetical protein
MRSLRRRVIALAAAYAIALAGLLASFGAASAAAATAGTPGGILCHNALTGESGPSTDQTNGKTCTDCCAGCLMTLAALPTPPGAGAPPQTQSYRAVPLALPAVAALRTAKSNRSRAPPLTA